MNAQNRVKTLILRKRAMMKVARIHKFGPPSVIVIEELPRPAPGHDEVLVRVAAAGVGPWDTLIREQKSVVKPPLPLILGSDLSGVIEEVGPGVSAFQAGDEIYGVTAAWRAVDPILGNVTPVYEYGPNTWGPPEADRIIADDGGWHNQKQVATTG